MPASAIIRGIIISISLIAALGIAVLENPQIQEWLEEQRRRIQDLLRSLGGEELDPESRQTAEAFAFEGRTPTNDEALRREMAGSRDAAAVATGASPSTAASIMRRIPVRGPSDPDEAEERRRKGREYLAKRNQQMYELQMKRQAELAGTVGKFTEGAPQSEASEAVHAEKSSKWDYLESLQHRSPNELQPYQVQLILLEAQNKRRLMMAREEQAKMGLAHGSAGSNTQTEAEATKSIESAPPSGSNEAVQVGISAPSEYPQNRSSHALQDYQLQLMLLEMQNKRRLKLAQEEEQTRMDVAHISAGRGAHATADVSPQTATSFDALVDADGKLKDVEMMLGEAPPPPPATELLPAFAALGMRKVDRRTVQPLLAGEAGSSMSGFQMGAALADPFSDEYEMDRSQTPKPPVPPKLELDHIVLQELPPMPMPGSFTPTPTEAPRALSEEQHNQLSYEEQLAIALSLSESESTNTATVRQHHAHDEDAELRAAIEASLKDMDEQQAAHALANADPPTPQPQTNRFPQRASSFTPYILPTQQPLVDLTPPSPILQPTTHPQRRQSDWEALFDPQFSPSAEPLSLAAHLPPASDAGTDELYRITPELTRARLASLDAQHAAPPSVGSFTMPFAPAHETAVELQPQPQSQQPGLLEASFYSAPSSASPRPRSTTLEHQPEVSDAAPTATATPAAPSEPSSLDFHSESESDTFASIGPSREHSRPRSEFSGAEVVDVEVDSDVDMLSEEGDGIVTPDSWTEVGSRDGESEAGEVEDGRQV